MSGTQQHAGRLARAGDDDLDVDVDGVTLTGVVRAGHEVWVRGHGGFGHFEGSDELWQREPGDDDAELTDLEIVVGLPTATDAQFDSLCEILERWRDEQTPLRLCAAPGRFSTLIEDTRRWVPPRRGPKPPL